MMINFTKAHACGNDFLIIEGVEPEYAAELAQHLCARTTGVGADGLELFAWTGERSGRIRLYNADGSVAEISGNGTRCVAAWMARKSNAVPGQTFTLETDAGRRECTIVATDGPAFEISTGMGVPQVTPASVTLDEEGIEIAGARVLTGNPHFVVLVEDERFEVEGRSWKEIGSAICVHPDFPEGTNVEFVRVVDTERIEMRVFERGVGPTSSSGTGTCASAAAAITLHNAARELRVAAPGGEQRVSWPSPEAEMVLIGPAIIVAEGEAFP